MWCGVSSGDIDKERLAEKKQRRIYVTLYNVNNWVKFPMDSESDPLNWLLIKFLQKRKRSKD